MLHTSRSLVGLAPRLWLLALLGIGAAGAGLAAQQSAGKVQVFKSPTCGCCSKWIEHMRAAGFEVTSQDIEDVAPVKAKHGVPTQAASCHTSVVGGYVVEGHVPADVVKRLLREKPADVVGIAVPGMPMGSPGMEVPSGAKDSYNIVSFDKTGRQTVFDKR